MAPILIASSDHSLTGRLKRILSTKYAIQIVAGWESLVETPKLEQCPVIMLDFRLLNETVSEKITALMGIAPKSKILLTGPQCSEAAQLTAFSHGIPGYVDSTADEQLLAKAIDKLLNGEVWIGRQAIAELLNDFRENSRIVLESGEKKDISMLTAREKEIARKICQGESNKRIANNLCISERTVKAHLSSIFRKLGIADRLQLAVSIKGHFYN